VDYIGDIGEFETSFALHAAVARAFGPYKLSLHSGSDKFSIYPVVARLAKGYVHLKTAGTSYLEALRTLALVDPDLFRQIFAFAVQRYPEDRAGYHVSAEIALLPRIDQLPDRSLTDLLENFHAREVLHVTYGSVLNDPQLRPALFSTLSADLEKYHRLVEAHFDRHFKPFA
jgi:tagaturonate epimerase